MKEEPLVPLAKSIPQTDAKRIQTSPPKPQKSFSKPAQLPPRKEKLSQNEPSVRVSISKHTLDFSSITKTAKNTNTNANANTSTNNNTKNHKSKTGLHVHEDETNTEDKLHVKRKRSNLASKSKSKIQERENSLPVPVSAPPPPAPPPTHVTNISSSRGDPPVSVPDPYPDDDIPSSPINDRDLPESNNFSSSKRESGESDRKKSQDKDKDKENKLISILNTTFKDQAKKVVINTQEDDNCKVADETAEEESEYENEDEVGEETKRMSNFLPNGEINHDDDDEFFGEDDYDMEREWDGEEWTYSFQQGNARNRQNQTMKKKAQKKSSAVQVPANREQLAHEEEIYNGMQIKTFGDLLEAKARRPRRLDAYCLGRGLMEPRLDIVEPQVIPRPSIKEFQLDGYKQFMDKIQQIQEENTQNEQIICVFTADLVRRNKKTWSEDCNLIEAAVVFLCRYLEPSGYLLWVRTGSQKGWKDPDSPFITDRHIVLKSLPTIKIWNSEKRLAGTRLFGLDNITVMIED